MKEILILLFIMALMGCVSGRNIQSYTWNDVPIQLRQTPTETVVIIRKDDPQPDPSTYIALGKISSFRPNVITTFERRGLAAIEMLKEEARRVGADAIINVGVSQESQGSYASGVSIRFTDWKIYGETNGGKIFYDAKSIRFLSKDIVRVRVKLEYTDWGIAEMVKAFGDRYKNFGHEITVEEINCSDKKIRILSSTYYNKEGNILFTNSQEGEWQFIVPELGVVQFYKTICK